MHTVGRGFTVTVTSALSIQVFAFVYVYRIVAEPADTPVTSPLAEFTVAVAVFKLLHKPPAGEHES